MAQEQPNATGGQGPANAGGDLSAPAISLPKGGGAVRSIGEKFAANPVTGTASFSVPLATSPGRSGFTPELALHYDSGAGNGPFGFGWHLSLPAISRRTDKKLPAYREDDPQQADVFVLTDAEDLVPVLVERDGEWIPDRRVRSFAGRRYEVTRYRPRIEGLFARIERFDDLDSCEVFWRSISSANVTTFYGKTPESRIVDPANPRRIFKWCVCESHDDRGNAILYEYAAEDGANVETSAPHERNRTTADRAANRYLKRVRYGNRTPHWAGSDAAANEWMFEVVFDYDEGHVEDIAVDPALPDTEQQRRTRASAAARQPWPVRPDPFSTHQAGFEIRTYRRCHRTLVFHHLPALPSGERGYDGLVRSTEFFYDDLDYAHEAQVEDELAHAGSTRFASFIRSITESGYAPDDPAAPAGTDSRTYIRKSLPPLEFEYSQAAINEQLLEIDPESVENLPIGLDTSAFQWIDLNGEGLSGVLTEQGGTWFYKPNLGDGQFGPLEVVASRPTLAALGSTRQQLTDLDGDGQLDLVLLGGTPAGFYERKDETWEPLRPFVAVPNIRWDDPNLRFIDLNGDGQADVLITGHDELIWHASLGEEGFAPARRLRYSGGEGRGPRLLFADGSESIYLADMCGDGLVDIVRIRNGEVCYWPNLGYGRFGAKVTMDNAPWFDHPNLFQQQRVRLADIDGSGTTDVIYLGPDGVRIYFNQSGNRLSDARRLGSFPIVNNAASVTVVDLLGNGTACLVWSSPLPAPAGHQLRYVDLMGGTKPHLLVAMRNNIGAETRVQYAPSTRFYVADRRDGHPWITKLPFPVHCVERVEVFDRISGNRYSTRYSYHHGFYDGVEREFRGFGRIDETDTEDIAALRDGAVPPSPNTDDSSYVPPVLRRSWYHTGAYIDRAHVSDYFAGLHDRRDTGEYYREPGLSDADARALLLGDTLLPDGLTTDEEREACRSLKGSLLRQEVFARDGTDREPHPFTVVEQNFTVRMLQPRRGSHPAVFHTFAREGISYNYERNPHDPRIAHSVTLDVDCFGNVLRSAAIAYGRREPEPALDAIERAAQARDFIKLTENRVTNLAETDDAYRTPLLADSRVLELTGLGRDAPLARWTFEELRQAATVAAAIAPEAQPTPGRIEKRPFEQHRTYFRSDDLQARLPLGELQPMGLVFGRFTLAFTRGLVDQVYEGRVDDALLADEGGYVHCDGDADWWIPSGRVFYSPDPKADAAAELAFARQHFFLPHRYRTAFHTPEVPTETIVTYDGYDLLIHETRDPLGSRVTVGERAADPNQPPVVRGHDYRALQPTVVMDPNRNRSAVAFDALGLVVAVAMMGKPEDAPVPGDRLAPDFRADLTQGEIDRFMADPKGPLAAALLGDATTRFVYDVTAFWREPDPAKKPPTVGVTLARETHGSDTETGAEVRLNVSFSYSDGFTREVQTKSQAEADPATGASRWVATGWTVFDNKGDPVRQYEPFFTSTHRFEFDVRAGVSLVRLYDPLQRAVATLHPNHSWEKVAFTAWRHDAWDVNDTVLIADPQLDPDVGPMFARLPPADFLPTWYALRTNPANAGAAATEWPDERKRDHERRTAEKTAVHAATPTIGHADALARTFVTVQHGSRQYSDDAVATPARHTQRTRTVLDIAGNMREVIDADGRVAARYTYDLRGNRVRQSSMEAGERWMLADVEGDAVRNWDSRGHAVRAEYDALRRPTDSFVSAAGGPELLVSRLVYGESRDDAEAINARGQVVQVFDQAGVLENYAYDFKGNLLRSARRLAREYRSSLDWSGEVPLEDEVYTNATRYDAFNRPLESNAPDGSVIQATYNEANLLERVDVNLRRERAHDSPTWTPFITALEYDAKGQRTSVRFGNGTSTSYRYEPLTFRLAQLTTKRKSAGADDGPGRVQDLQYTYDPAGNVTFVRDDAQQATFFRNRRVEPGSEYTYDAFYRLIEATGREHRGQHGDATRPSSHTDLPRVGLLHPGDGNAMAEYLERYLYDAVGNVLQIQHRIRETGAAGWTRRFVYNEPSQIEPARRNNRLTTTHVGEHVERYSRSGEGYDAHGNLLRLPHLAHLQWDFRDLLQMTQRQIVDARHEEDGSPGERTWYVYDLDGRRVRKVTDDIDGRTADDRVYLGRFEIHRKSAGEPAVRETLHIMDGTRRVALIQTRVSGDDAGPAQLIRYQYENHLGSAALELDDRARIISYEEYTPFGSTAYQAVRSQTETPKRYRYTGAERDEESGFYYLGQRYYAPWLGRWTRPDPAGFVDGTNLYAYVRNNPIRFDDPSGTQCDPETASCVDPTEPAPTPREEELQQSLPEDERYLPAPSEPTEAEQALGQSLPESERYLPVEDLVSSPSTPDEDQADETETYGEEFEEYEETYVEWHEETYEETETASAQAGTFMMGTLAVAGGTSQLDSPVPGPADVVAAGEVVIGGIIALGILAFASTTVTTRTRTWPEVRTRTRTRQRPLVYVTYTKTNAAGTVYTGRSRGYGTPQQVVAARDMTHHMTALGFGPAVLDESAVATRSVALRWTDPSYQAIRGREQQMIDFHGGSLSDGGTSGNAIRGVSAINPLGWTYHLAASAMFGEIHPYTGN